MDFSKATVLITGGNSGIGKGLAEALASRGAEVIITGRNSVSLMSTLKANPSMRGYQLDVSDAEDIKQFAAMIIARHPSLNAVIHNAGIMVIEDVLADSFDLGVVEQTITTNLLAPIRLTAALLPHLRNQTEAAIVTVSSGLAFVPRADTPTYGATKAAIHSWSQSLRRELRNTNIFRGGDRPSAGRDGSHTRPIKQSAGSSAGGVHSRGCRTSVRGSYAFRSARPTCHAATDSRTNRQFRHRFRHDQSGLIAIFLKGERAFGMTRLNLGTVPGR